MEDVAIAGDCVQQLAAIMMKKQFGDKYNKYAVYMGDMAFNVAIDNEGYIARSAIKSNEIDIKRNFVRKKKIIIQNDYKATVRAISDALATEGYAVLRTVDAYLPFSIYYVEDGSYDINTFQELGHVIMIVYEDEENYYFIEQLQEMNEDKYTHVKSRKDIGWCSKEVFKKALSVYAKIFTFEFNEQGIIESTMFVDEIISKSVEHFYGNISTRISRDKRGLIIGGQAALEYLGVAYNEGKIVLNKKVYNSTLKGYCDFDIGRELMNGATGLKNRRLVLKGFLEERKQSEKDRDLIIALDRSIKIWDRFKNRIIKKCYKKDFCISEKELVLIEEIISAEKKLFELLRDNF